MYWHGAEEDTKRTVNKIIADGSKGIVLLTSIGSSPPPLEDLKSALDSISLHEMQVGPEEELFIDAKGIPRTRYHRGLGSMGHAGAGAQAQAKQWSLRASS